MANPPPGGNPYIRASRAARQIARGVAVLDERGQVVFDPRREIAIELERECCYDRAVNRREGTLDRLLAQMAAIPIQRPGIALGLGQVRHR